MNLNREEMLKIKSYSYEGDYMIQLLINSYIKNLSIDGYELVKVDNNNISAVCISEKHDNSLANNIMRLIQEQYKSKKYITVKFQNS